MNLRPVFVLQCSHKIDESVSTKMWFMFDQNNETNNK